MSRPELYELISEIGFIRIREVFNDFVYRPLTRSMAWVLRNLSILLENMPVVRTLAGSILVQAQKPPRDVSRPRVSLFQHEALRHSVSVVIPCHNEEMNIGPLVSGLRELFGEYLYEIIPVDDNSTDSTGDVIRRLASEDPKVKPIMRAPPNGVGRALADGYRAATGEWVLSMDCDFQHLLPEVRDLFDAAARRVEDVVAGSRFSRHSVLLNYPFRKIVANRGFHLLAQLVLRRRFRDLTNNLKLMRRAVAERLRFTQPGFAVNAETGLQPLLMGYEIKEVPISWINRTPEMGMSSFHLASVGGGFCQVLLYFLLKDNIWPWTLSGHRSAQARIERHGASERAPARGPRLTRTALTGLLIFLAFCAVIRIALVEHHGLWIRRVLLAGHGDRAQSGASSRPGRSGSGGLRQKPRGLSHLGLTVATWNTGTSPGTPRRVVRAVFLSDTNPPLVLSFVVRLDAGLRHRRCCTSPFLRAVLACLLPGPLVARQSLWEARVPRYPPVSYSRFHRCASSIPLQGRMYSLLVLGSVCTIWLTLRLWDKGPRPLTFSLWIAAGVAGLLTHYFFLFVWIAVVFWLQSHPGRFPRWLSGAGALLIVSMILPWYLHVPESLAQWRVTGHWLKIRPSGYDPVTRALSLPWSFLSIDGVWGRSRRWGLINAGVYALLAVAALRRLSWSILSTPRSLLWLWLLSPCLGMVAFDLIRGTYVTAVPRYALAGMPAAFLLVGLALGSLEHRLRAIFIGLIGLLCLVSVRRFYGADARSGQNYPAVAKLLLSYQVDKSDLILVHSIPSGVVGIARYLERGHASETGVGFASWVGQLGRRRVPEDIEALATGRRRIFLITTHEVGEPAPEKSWLEENTTTPVGMERIHGATVYAFRPRDSTTLFE